MTTPLILKAPQFLQTVTHFYWYPHLILFDSSENQYKTRQLTKYSQINILLYYLINLFAVPVLGLGSCLFQIAKYFLFEHKTINGLQVVIFGSYAFMSIFQWGYNIPVLTHGKSMVNYINALLVFEKHIKNSQMEVRNKSKSGSRNFNNKNMIQSKTTH